MISQTLGHYRIIEKIGAGGMGQVYRAHDEHLEREVALKVLPIGTLADESARKRFPNEALALSKLNHPNIATVFDFDAQGGVDFLAMELVPGEVLNQRLKAGALKEQEVVNLGTQISEGLAAAHAQGIVHRDLKPGNVLITPEGRLKIKRPGGAAGLCMMCSGRDSRNIVFAHGIGGIRETSSPGTRAKSLLGGCELLDSLTLVGHSKQTNGTQRLQRVYDDDRRVCHQFARTNEPEPCEPRTLRVVGGSFLPRPNP